MKHGKGSVSISAMSSFWLCGAHSATSGGKDSELLNWKNEKTKLEEQEEDQLIGFTALSRLVIGAAIRVHRALGPGLLESAYRRCLVKDLELEGHAVATEVTLPLMYRGLPVEVGCRVDLIVDREIIVEVKSVAHLALIHKQQLFTYMKLAGIRTGMLMNFNVPKLTDGLFTVHR